MMLTFLEGASGIEAAEPEVAAVWRSADALNLPAKEEPLPAAQGFVCLLRKEEDWRVYVALHARELRRGLIYAAGPAEGGRGAHEEILRQVLALAEALGLRMESVNLKYGTALREVVVRSIPVLLPPGGERRAAEQRAAELTELERLAAEPVAEDAREALASELPPARRAAAWRAQKERLAAIEAARRRLAAEEMADRRIAALRAAFESLLAETFAVPSTPAAAVMLQPAVAVVPPEAGGGPVREEAAVPAAARVEAELSPMPAAEAQRFEAQRLAQERAEFERQIAELTETARQAAEWAQAERSEAERLAAGKAEAERRAAESAEAARHATEQAAAERRKRERLTLEKAAMERRADELAQALEAATQTAESERREREQLEAGKAALERQLAEMTAAARLAEARCAGETPGNKELVAARRKIEQLAAQNQAVERRAAEAAEAARAAQERVEAERLERQRLTLEKVEVERRLGELAAAASAPPPASVAESKVVSVAAAGPGPRPEPATPPPPPAPRPPVPGAFFQVDWSLSDIGYAAPEEVVEIHQGVTLALLSLEGYPSQYCSAYVVVLKKGRGRQVHVAFRLAASNRTLVYLPATPSHNQAAYQKAMQEAFKFLRVVGIDTERVPLESNPERRVKTLSLIPVLSSPPRSAQGF